LLAVPHLAAEENSFGLFDALALFCWGVGFSFEAGGDWQLAQFKADPVNKGKVLDQGFWKYTRHPNYFGDAAVWWGYGLFSVASGSYWPMIGPLLMTGLIIQVSGVRLLERTLVDAKPEYRDYVERTSIFFPWPPKASASSRTTSQQER
jgi:steroid 5-alpha reductase family enzyme